MSDSTFEDLNGEHWNIANDHAGDVEMRAPFPTEQHTDLKDQVWSLKAALRTAQLQWIRSELLLLGYPTPQQVVARYELVQGLPVLEEILVDGEACPAFLSSDAANELSALMLFDFDPDAEAWQLMYVLADQPEELPF